LMTVPPNVSASASASADLPLAVGPAMIRTGGLWRAPVREYDPVAWLWSSP
jgi:hypothetical protein